MTGEPADEPGCIFCAIANAKIATELVLSGSDVVVVRDIAPVAPTHLLVIPRQHIDDVSALQLSHGDLLAQMLVAANSAAKLEGLSERGWRLVFNVGDDAGNTVAHLHLHLLGGRSMSWPPG